MKRRRAKQEEAKPAMFPFLDVLICTAGTLIILLIVIASQAWQQAVQAEEETEEPAKPAATSVEDAAETWVNRAKQAEENRGQVAAVVSGRRTELGYLEQALREQQTKIVEMEAAVKAGVALSTATDEQVANTAAELGRLERSLAESQEHLKELRQSNPQRQKTFSIIPYEGKNGTTRIPIYIECRADRVIVHPGGVELSSDDFLFSDDAGNPLATLLRATREQMVVSRPTSANEEPYPLILIRPDGIGAYYHVRQSLQGWTAEFGYELIDKDWKLKFPVQDPKLFEIQQRALAEARLRQQALMVAFKRKAKRGSQFVAAPRAGILNQGGAGGTGVGTTRPEDDQEGASFGEPGFAGGKGGNGSGAAGFAHDGAGGGTAGSAVGGWNGDGVGNGVGTGIGTGTSNGGSQLARGTGNGGMVGDGTRGDGSGGRGTRPGGVGDTNAASGNGNQFAGGNTNTNGANTGGANSPGGNEFAANGSSASATHGGPYSQGSAQPGDFRGGQSGSPGGTTGDSGTAAAGSTNGSAPGSGSTAAANGASGSGASGGSNGGGSSGGGAAGGADSGQSSSFGSPSMGLPPKEELGGLAKKRGRNWGLRYAEPAATPITRPIRIVCERQRLMIMPSDRQQSPRQIVLASATRESVDPLVAAVWDEIKGWGIAGKGMYWKPILTFDVRPDGEARFKDLEQLLSGSGLEVRRSAAQQATLPGGNGGRR
jgi:hypothetical protein